MTITLKRLVLLIFLLLAAFLLSCSPGHIGNNEISFVRDGQLWTIDPDGANAFEVTSNDTQVIGYAWSPDHHILAFRILDSNFSKTAQGQHISSNPVTGLTKDLPSVLNTIGIDGGTPIPIALSSAGIQHSNAWWNPSGNRLLYREEATSAIQNAGTQSWWISQNDQPLDIARNLLPYTFSIPSLSTNNMAIGNSRQGVFSTSLAGIQFQFIVQGQLPGHPLPASLERILWQPAHLQPAILYAIATDSSSHQSSNNAALPVHLILRDSHEQNRTIATCSCTQFAWSPDGNFVLYSTGTLYTILNTKDLSSFTISGEFESVPYWSPDSRFIILDGQHTLQLVSVANQLKQPLLTGNAPGSDPGFLPVPSAEALLQPISNSIWASDSQQFLFLTRNRLSWQGKNLNPGNGLYTVSIDDNGTAQGSPAIVDSGNDSQAGWTYEDPNTSFLF
ncbi:MAG TPA: hypothetical protein VEH81_13350 [Ktedonobacteraceae bacterium]|nr:hypothetical protein [Ktedonobacteraceae bacterium]